MSWKLPVQSLYRHPTGSGLLSLLICSSPAASCRIGSPLSLPTIPPEWRPSDQAPSAGPLRGLPHGVTQAGPSGAWALAQDAYASRASTLTSAHPLRLFISLPCLPSLIPGRAIRSPACPSSRWSPSLPPRPSLPGWFLLICQGRRWAVSSRKLPDLPLQRRPSVPPKALPTCGSQEATAGALHHPGDVATNGNPWMTLSWKQAWNCVQGFHLWVKLGTVDMGNLRKGRNLLLKLGRENLP